MHTHTYIHTGGVFIFAVISTSITGNTLYGELNLLKHYYAYDTDERFVRNSETPASGFLKKFKTYFLGPSITLFPHL